MTWEIWVTSWLEALLCKSWWPHYKVPFLSSWFSTGPSILISCSSSVAQSCPTLCDPMNHSMRGLPVHQQPPQFTQIHVYGVGDTIQPSHPLSSPSPLPLNLSQHQVFFSNESALRIRWPKYWSFSFNISPSNEHQELISFRMNWLDFLAVQGTLKSLLQHHSSKVSIPPHSAVFIDQLSHPYMTTGKIIALTKTDICWQSDVSAFQYAV